ncbi:hypothetical protein SAMN04487939_101240 [Lysobacter sp. yr284]|uniref:hypothetical protein n=1 Tax=Lysobacter sp. yr284 TaxID=1761791 RepID=UPI000896319F|nr:hypothetical protein [Lysobacter sp. yr284]SDY20717.1 hypothetical protein SAMN04487939_101240 [Lysobacter sp. yr284]
MLTAAAIRCTVALWPGAAAAATVGDCGDGEAPPQRDPQDEAAAAAEPLEPRRPS